jgi:hypothetical protein
MQWSDVGCYVPTLEWKVLSRFGFVSNHGVKISTGLGIDSSGGHITGRLPLACHDFDGIPAAGIPVFSVNFCQIVALEVGCQGPPLVSWWCSASIGDNNELCNFRYYFYFYQTRIFYVEGNVLLFWEWTSKEIILVGLWNELSFKKN